MSKTVFFGSIGNLMDGSGLKQALETVYATVTVGHIFTGKACFRSVQQHIQCASAVQSTLIEEFWNNLSPGDKEKLETYYNSNDPCIFEGEELAIRLKILVEEKHNDLSKSSRTSAFWCSYVRYVSIIQG